MGKLIMVASGKGGVGKSSLSAALGVSAAQRGLQTLLLDADFGLRSLDLMLGVQDQVLYELSDCLKRRCSLEQALVQHPKYPKLSLLIGGQDAKPKDFSGKDLSRIMKTLKGRFDLLLVDCPAGIGRGVKNFIGLADRYVLVATPDDVCLRDTEKLGKLILEETGEHADLLLNRYDWQLSRLGAISRPDAIALALDMPLLGTVSQSPAVYSGQLQCMTMAELSDTAVTEAVTHIGRRLQGIDAPAFVEVKQTWREKLLSMLSREVKRP
ncbi:MAG: P-loop NTPase [Christensenellales bacterium]